MPRSTSPADRLADAVRKFREHGCSRNIEAMLEALDAYDAAKRHEVTVHISAPEPEPRVIVVPVEGPMGVRYR